MSAKNYREINAAEILEWRRSDSPLIRVRTDTDAVPGGLAMAMAPMFVKWDASLAGFGPDDYYLVQNVNILNNPVGAVTVLGTLKVWADSVDHTEFVMVISKVKGVETQAGHGMLRFVFREDRRPLILDRPWRCYPLKLPDVEHAHNELLYVSLAMADAVARQTVLNLLDRRIEKGKNLPEDYPEAELDDWETLADVYRNSKVPEDPIQDILEGKIRYHLLERSCITMALSSVDWANRRIHDRAGLREPKQIRVAPEAIPSKAHELLDEVGLLHNDGGRIREARYDNRHQTPYGDLGDNLIY